MLVICCKFNCNKKSPSEILKICLLINTNNTTINGGDCMKLTKNIGELDSLLRLSFGFSMLGYGIAKKAHLPILIGSWKIAEGITGFSVTYHLLGIDTLDNKFNFHGGKELILNPVGNESKIDDMK